MRGGVRSMNRKLLIGVAVLAAVTAGAQEEGALVGAFELQHLVRALDRMNMTTNDLGFARDVGEPEVVLESVRRMLRDPAALAGLGDDVLALARTNAPGSVWAFCADCLGARDNGGGPAGEGDTVDLEAALDPALADGIRDFARRAAAVRSTVSTHLATMGRQEAEFLLASVFGGVFNVGDDPDARRALLEHGLSEAAIEEALREEDAIDPRPGRVRFARALRAFDAAAVTAAARMLEEAVAALASDVTAVRRWPEAPVTLHTPAGSVRIGSLGPDRHETPMLLVLDPGGDDVYANGAGGADGLAGRPVAAVLDLGGADRYASRGVSGAGSAFFGVCVVADAGGDDVYTAAFTGQGAGVFGAALLEDRAGNDLYRARAMAQGAGYAGCGVLRDGGGRDVYDVGFYGQGFAGVLGVGLLFDADGDDRYLAGGVRPDHERNDQRYLSLAQGFSIGARPLAGGGLGALVDLAGNDVYEADVYGQGAGYWYSVGLLLDAGGHDSYRVYQYGQGSGIHLSCGLLADAGGNDRYTGYVLSQGNAHDYAVGLLLDKGGDDTYTADHYSQGRGMFNALGALIDSGGADGYFARQTPLCQGAGHDGGPREYGSLALLLDLGGPDVYSVGISNGTYRLRPDFGIVYDVEE